MCSRHAGRARAATCVAAMLAVACATPPREKPTLPTLLRAVAPPGIAFAETLPDRLTDDERLRDVDAVVIGGEDPHGAAAWRERDLRVLKGFIERGGRVLLLGHALALATDLGLETVAPESREFRWGFDARATTGAARLGLLLVSGELPELCERLRRAAVDENAFWLAGGAPCRAVTCVFPASGPANGKVLARLCREVEGAFASDDAAVLVRWRLGRGEVLGFGLEPDAAAADADVAANAAAFSQAAVQWLLRAAQQRRLGCWTLPPARPDRGPEALSPVAEREVPGRPVPVGFGLALDLGSASAPDELVATAADAAAAGASVVALDVVDAARALPVPWAEGDALARPKGYRTAPPAVGWPPRAIQWLARELHARGLQLQAVLDPVPGGDTAAERLATLRFLARELADLRRLGECALDGFALREWFADARGLAVAMVQDFQPRARIVASGAVVPVVAAAVHAQDADDGRVRGLAAAGLGAGFRRAPAADARPVGYLDAAPGSHGDWIAEQAVEYARSQRGAAVMSWRLPADVRARAEVLDYVYGVGQEPLVAAVAARCTSTGIDGWRHAQSALLDVAVPSFGSTANAPAATVLLQNNHLRLLGSGGALAFDRTGRAGFDGDAVQLASAWMRTRLRGARPDPMELNSVDVDWLRAERRGEGGHLPCVAVSPGGPVPRALAHDAAPRWPQRLELPLPAATGSFRLALAMRPIAGQGVVAVSVDDAIQFVLPFQDGRLAIDRELPLQLARAGSRRLVLEALDGGVVALDRLQLRRAGDVGAEAEPWARAGGLAVAVERSASTYHQERVELRMVADLSALVVQSTCERAVRGLQQERTFDWVHHRTLRLGGADPETLREPFVLAADDASLPDLCVVPLLLGRYDRFAVAPNGLHLRGPLEPGARTAVAFVLLPRDEATTALPHLAAAMRTLVAPPVVDLRAADRTEVVDAAPVPFPWPRLLELRRITRTPLLVRERGWWTWRGVQAVGDAELLRVWQWPGDTVAIASGTAVLQGTRPAAGSQSCVALRDVADDTVVVRVLADPPLGPAGVTFAGAFDEVTLDGRPWAHFCERTVYLPPGAGTYRLATRRRGAGATPHVIAASAALPVCTWDADRRTLEFVAAAGDRPTALPFTAIVVGGPPSRIDGGEIVPEPELRHASAQDQEAARRGGCIVRFRAGLVQLHYGD